MMALKKPGEKDKRKTYTAEHLKKHQFKKGVSGNPQGLAVGTKQITAKLRRFGNWQAPEIFKTEVLKLFPKMKDKLTMDDLTWLGVWICATKGEPWAVNFIAERLEGKARTMVGPLMSEGDEDNDATRKSSGLDPSKAIIDKKAVVDTAEKLLYDAVRAGQQWAIKFTLETIGKERGYTGETAPEDKKGQLLSALDTLMRNAGGSPPALPPAAPPETNGDTPTTKK